MPDKNVIALAHRLRSANEPDWCGVAAVSVPMDEALRALVSVEALETLLRAVGEREGLAHGSSPTWGVGAKGRLVSLLSLSARVSSQPCFQYLWQGSFNFASKQPEDSPWRVRMMFDFEESLRDWNAVVVELAPKGRPDFKGFLDPLLEDYFALFGAGARERFKKLFAEGVGMNAINDLSGRLIDNLIEQWDGGAAIREEFKDV